MVPGSIGGSTNGGILSSSATSMVILSGVQERLLVLELEHVEIEGL